MDIVQKQMIKELMYFILCIIGMCLIGCIGASFLLGVIYAFIRMLSNDVTLHFVEVCVWIDVSIVTTYLVTRRILRFWYKEAKRRI